ncbi:MAG: fused MFS/spermidine synthase [Holophagales bacterium]|nr:fused MFS/spermidine synthase [Holophagales bacterium]
MVDRASGPDPRFPLPPTASRRPLWRKEPPKNVFVIGLGAGMIPRYFSEKAPQIATTSVEIDPEVVRVAEKYFDFRPDANDRVLVGDGRSILVREKGPWDAIFLDAFFSDSVPFHLTTLEFFELCRDRLAPAAIFAGKPRRPHDGPRPASLSAPSSRPPSGSSPTSPSSRPSSRAARRRSRKRHPPSPS